MSKWEMVRLGDCFLFVRNGMSIKQKKTKEGYPITRIETISNETVDRKKMGYAGINDVSDYQNYLLRDGDILMSHIISIKHLGKSALYIAQDGEKIIHGMNLLCLRCDKKQLISMYAHFYFSSQFFKHQLQSLIKPSVNQASFTVTDLKKTQIPLPPLDIQRSIAATLDQAAALIALRKQQIEQLDLLVKARFVEMFGDPVRNKRGFPVTKLNSCCIINPKKADDKTLTDELHVTFLAMPAVSEYGNIDLTETRSYAEVKTGFTYFAENDVLFAKITPCMENKKGAVARGLKNGVGFGSTEFHVLRPKPGVSHAQWLYHLTHFDWFRKIAAENMTGSAGQRRVPLSFLANYAIPLPPLPLQQQFAAFVEQVETQKQTLKQAQAKMQMQYDALMQEYFG